MWSETGLEVLWSVNVCTLTLCCFLNTFMQFLFACLSLISFTFARWQNSRKTVSRERFILQRSLAQHKASEQKTGEWKINGHCQFYFGEFSSRKLANDRRLKLFFGDEETKSRRKDFMELFWLSTKSRRFLQLLFMFGFATINSSLNKHKAIKTVINLLGYWKSVGGVRFWVIAILWWFWCMTSDSGIVVPVKNMFWLRFCVPEHPNCFAIYTTHWLPIQVHSDDDDDWWMMDGKKLKKIKIKST